MKKTNIFHVGLLTLGLISSSCDVSYLDKDIEDFTWDGSVEAPIGTITYTVSELFEELGNEDLIVGSNSENLVSFTYSKELNSSDNSNYDVEVKETTITSSIATPITAEQFTLVGGSPYTIPPGSPLAGDQTDGNQTVRDLALDQDLTSAEFSGGTLTMTLTSTFDSEVDITLSIPSISPKSGGGTYSETRTLTSAGPTVVTLNLADYNADFTHDGTAANQTVNSFVVSVSAIFKFREGDQLKDTDGISYSAVLSGAQTSIVFGDFKQDSFNVNNQTIALDFFDNFGADGVVEFSNPTLKFTATNKFGFPIGINLDNISGTNNTETRKLTYDLTGATPNKIVIGEATYDSSTKVVTEKVTNVTIDNTNSNLADLLAIKPTSFNLDVTGNANPINQIPNLNFFSSTTNGLNVKMDMEIPLDVKFENVPLEQTVAFDAAEDIDELKGAELKLFTENLIPLSGTIELTFLGTGGTVLNLNKNITVFDAADTFDSNGRATVAKTKTTTLSFSESEIEELKKTKDIKLVIKLNTPTDNAVKLHSDATIKATIGGKIKAEVGSDN